MGELNRDSIDKGLDRLDKAKDQGRSIGKSQERQLRKPNGQGLRKSRKLKVNGIILTPFDYGR